MSKASKVCSKAGRVGGWGVLDEQQRRRRPWPAAISARRLAAKHPHPHPRTACTHVPYTTWPGTVSCPCLEYARPPPRAPPAVAVAAGRDPCHTGRPLCRGPCPHSRCGSAPPPTPHRIWACASGGRPEPHAVAWNTAGTQVVHCCPSRVMTHPRRAGRQRGRHGPCCCQTLSRRAACPHSALHRRNGGGGGGEGGQGSARRGGVGVGVRDKSMEAGAHGAQGGVPATRGLTG